MGLLDGLVRAGLVGATGYMQGQQRGRDIARERAIEERKAQEEALRQNLLNELTRAQTESTRALAQDRLQPDAPAPRNIDPLSPDGIRAAVERARALQGVEPQGGGEAVNWQTMTDAQGRLVQVHPRTGQIRPVEGVQMRVPGSGTTAPAGGGRALPTNVINDMTRLDALDQQIDDAMETVRANPDAIGPLDQFKPNFLFPEHAQARARIGSIAARLLNDLSGAAISEQEYKRLRQFVPTNSDTHEVALTKLRELKLEMGRVREMRLRAYQANGYAPFRGAGDAPAAPAASVAGQVAPRLPGESVEAYLARTGGAR